MANSDFEDLMRIQRMMASRVAQEVEVDNKIKLLDIIRDMPEGKRGIPVEKILVEARIQGLTDSETMRLLDMLKSDGLLKSGEDKSYVKPS